MGKKGKVGLAAVAALVLCTNAGVAEAKQQTNTLVPERNNALVPDGQCAIQVASRRTLEESVAFIDTLRPNFTEIRVFRAENGWHAISVGLYSIEQGAQATQDFVERGLIPADSFCYTGYAAGRAYVAEVDWLSVNSGDQTALPEALEISPATRTLTDLEREVFRYLSRQPWCWVHNTNDGWPSTLYKDSITADGIAMRETLSLGSVNSEWRIRSRNTPLSAEFARFSNTGRRYIRVFESGTTSFFGTILTVPVDYNPHGIYGRFGAISGRAESCDEY